MTKINFIYAKGLGFFAEIKEMRSIINQKKSEYSYSKFTPEADELEIGRGLLPLSLQNYPIVLKRKKLLIFLKPISKTLL